MSSAPSSFKRPGSKPARSAAPPSKRARLSLTPAPAIPTSPGSNSSDTEPTGSILPTRILDLDNLPILTERQSPCLDTEDYQSIANSMVLQASLQRSRVRWTHDGILERYWVKPETGKNAKPPPANNPDAKLIKSKGPCRIRIEPHIFEAEMYLDEKNKPKVVPAPPAHTRPYNQPSVHNLQGHPFRQHQAPQPALSQPQHPPQARPIPPPPRQQVHRVVPASSISPVSHVARPPQAAASAQTPIVRPKASPDPVITLLAERASADPVLKLLMKEVATGKANPDQLRIFQRHIDELTAIIQARDRWEQEQAAAKKRPSNQTSVPQYDGPTDLPQQSPTATASRTYGASAVPSYQVQQHWVPPPPPPPPVALPVVLQFTSQGSTEDRFLFPQYSILEALSKQHTLASFIVTRKEQEISNHECSESNREFWQPITMMVEVAYGREELLNHIRKWVKPPDEVRRHMQEIMSRATRAPDNHLAFRLPLKSDLRVTNLATVIPEISPRPKADLVTQTNAGGLAQEKATDVDDGTVNPEANKVPSDEKSASAPCDVEKETSLPSGSHKSEPLQSRRTTRKSGRFKEGQPD